MKRPFFLLILLFVVACTPPPALEQPSPTALPTSTETATARPTAVPPTPTLSANTSTPSPTATPAAAEPFQFDSVSLNPDPAVVATFYPSVSEDGHEIAFHFAEEGHCVIDGCILFTKADALPAVLSEMMAAVETAVTSQDNSYVFKTDRVALILQSHTRLQSTEQLQGIRAVTVKTQNLPFISNNALTYEYRGITTDGSYFVQLWLPVSLPFLPDSGDPGQENQPHFAVPLPELTTSREEELYPILEAYNEEVAVFVHAAADDTFTPDLAAIDALIQSITFANTAGE